MGAEAEEKILETFKLKISDCIAMVGMMKAEERITAIEYWNNVSEQLQQVIDKVHQEEIEARAIEDQISTPSSTAEVLDVEEPKLSGKLNIVEQIRSSDISNIGSEHQYHFVLGSPSVEEPAKRPVATKSGNSVLKNSVVDVIHGKDGNTFVLGHDKSFLLKRTPDTEAVEILTGGLAELGEPGVEELSEELQEDQFGMGDLSGQVLIVGEDAHISGEQVVTVKHDAMASFSQEEEDEEVEEMKESEITPEMASVATVNLDSNPPPVDESAHRVSRKNPGSGGVETVYQCEICQKTFLTSAGLTSHRWQHTKPFQCDHCKQRFASKGNLVIHNRRHTGEKPFKCHLCDSKFSTKGNLKRHVQTHTGVKPWKCEKCEGRFTEKKSLKIHMRKHTGERPYNCKVCGKKFAQTSILRSHLAMHMDKRAHLCDLCGRSFRQKSQLRLHVQRHNGMKKYDCDYCESKFLTKGDLERHHKSHLGTRDFSCKLCPKNFTRQQTLNEHMNRHYGLKPFECKVCRKTFSEMSTVYKHVKSHEKHRNEKDSESHIIIHNLDAQPGEPPQIVEHVVDDAELGTEDLMEDVVVKIDKLDNGLMNIDDVKEQFIYLETTGVDGSVSITEATVYQDGNLRIHENESLKKL